MQLTISEKFVFDMVVVPLADYFFKLEFWIRTTPGCYHGFRHDNFLEFTWARDHYAAEGGGQHLLERRALCAT